MEDKGKVKIRRVSWLKLVADIVIKTRSFILKQVSTRRLKMCTLKFDVKCWMGRFRRLFRDIIVSYFFHESDMNLEIL